ncbi:MAG: TonB-dependent receptor [Chlorobiaceae bacterium]|nr:TonB-dependent receptor [Chlorobiaceae bacterium]
MAFLKKRHGNLLSVAAAIGCVTGYAQAAELSPEYQGEEVIVTATRTPNTVSRLPMAVEVITRAQIEESGALNLSDVLAEAHDVNAEASTNGRLGVAMMRGLDSRMTLVLVDGIRLTSGFQGYVDLHEIPSGIIERIEIVRGAGSALYGSDAVGGVVNVITRKPRREPQAGLTLSGGESRYAQVGTVQTDGWVSGTTGKLGYGVAGSWYDRDRYDRDTRDLTTDGDDRRTASGSVALTYALTPDVKLTSGTIYAWNRLDGIRAQTSGNFGRVVDSDRLMAYAGAEIRTGTTSNLSLRVSKSTYDWSSEMDNLGGLPYVTTAVTSGIKTTTATNTKTLTKVSQDATQFDAQWTGTISGTNRLTAGVEYRTEERDDYSKTLTRKVVTKNNISTGVITSGPTTTSTTDLSNISHDSGNLGLFAQDEFRVSEQLSFIAGVRFDDHSDFGSEVSPKIASVLRIDEHLKLRASYGEGFRAPSLYELYTGSVQSKKSIILANPDLDAETSRSFELGADFVSGAFESGITGFRTGVKNMILQALVDATTTPATYRFENVSEAMTRGIEFRGSFKLQHGWMLADQVSFLDTRNETTGSKLLFAPAFTNMVKLSYANPGKGLKGNIRVISTGSQYISASEKAGGYTLVNCFVSKTVSKGTELFAGADNLFNHDTSAAYGNNEGAGMTGTYFYGGLNYRL